MRVQPIGGTPEQLVWQKQEEAEDKASLVAIQQAQSERQQALGAAQALGGMFSAQAGLSSQLHLKRNKGHRAVSAGISAKMQAQLEAEGFGREMHLLALDYKHNKLSQL